MYTTALLGIAVVLYLLMVIGLTIATIKDLKKHMKTRKKITVVCSNLTERRIVLKILSLRKRDEATNKIEVTSVLAGAEVLEVYYEMNTPLEMPELTMSFKRFVTENKKVLLNELSTCISKEKSAFTEDVRNKFNKLSIVYSIYIDYINLYREVYK